MSNDDKTTKGKNLVSEYLPPLVPEFIVDETTKFNTKAKEMETRVSEVIRTALLEKELKDTFFFKIHMFIITICDFISKNMQFFV